MTEQPQPPADVANDPSLIQVYDKIRPPIVCHQRNVTNRRAARNDPFELGQSKPALQRRRCGIEWRLSRRHPQSHRADLKIASYKQSHTHAAANSGANDDNCGSD